MVSPFRISREIYVPQLENGFLHYIMMEIVAASDVDSGWAIKAPPAPAFPTTTVPSTVPSAVSFKAMSDLDTPRLVKGGLQATSQDWSAGAKDNLE
jgi:hypothetical protein